METSLNHIKASLYRMYPGAIIGEPVPFSETISSWERADRFNGLTNDSSGKIKRVFFGNLSYTSQENTTITLEAYARLHWDLNSNNRVYGLMFNNQYSSGDIKGKEGTLHNVLTSYIDFVQGYITFQFSGWLIPISFQKRGYINNVYGLGFGEVPSGVYTETFFPISATGLTSDLVLSLAGTDNKEFALSKNGVDWLSSVTLSPDALGDVHERNIKIRTNAPGAGSKSAYVSCDSTGTESEQINLTATVV